MKVISINNFLPGICLAFLSYFSPMLTFGQESYTHEFVIQNDNDAYLLINQDQYYTNGVNFSYRSLRKETLPTKQLKQIWEINLGHKLYNAYNGYSEYNRIDRPFTAYLYLNVGNTWFYKDESIFSITSEIGLYGKGAFGKPLQEGFHHLFGFYDLNGWQYQLKGNITLDIRASYGRLLWRNRKGTMDMQGTIASSLGLNQTYLGGGPLIRLGRINAFFESSLQRSRLNGDGKGVRSERYFYYSPQLFYRLYDASIEGGLLLNDKGPITFGIKPWVFDQRIGFVYAKKRITVDAHLIFNTREVRSWATAHQYAAISLGYAF